MDAKKILEVLDIYDARLRSIAATDTAVKPERADTNKKYSSQDSAPVYETKLNHTWWAVGQCREFTNAGRLEKAFRWLGFIQGALWFAGKYSIEELANHNKPAGEETNLDHSRR